MSAYQLKDGRWVVQYRDLDNPDKYKREYFGRGKEAELAAKARDAEISPRPYRRRKPKAVAEEGPLFQDLATAYIEAKGAGFSQISQYNLWKKLTAIILPELGNADVYRLTARRLDQYVIRRLGMGVKKTTVHRELSDIQAILNFAADPARRLITRNPVAGYKKPKRDDDILRPPSRTEADNLLANSAPHLIRALALCYYTGMRPGQAELFRIRWSDVDWDEETMLVRSAKKGGPVYRIVPIHPGLLPELKAWYQEDEKQDVEIIRYRGKPITTVKSAFRTAKKKAGITRRLPPYAFRHAFVTRILDEGGDLKSTSEIAGHSRPDTTTRTYRHTSLTEHRKAVMKLPALTLPKKK